MQMAGWWENCITTTFIESNNWKQNDCQFSFFICIFFLKSCFVFWFLSFRTAAPLISTPDASLFPLNNSAVICFFFSSCGVPPPLPTVAVFHCRGCWRWLTCGCFAFHCIALLFMQMLVFPLLLLTAHESHFPRSYKLQLHRFGSLTRWWDFSSIFNFQK